MTVPANPIAIQPGSAAVTNLLRLVRSEAAALAAFAAIPGAGGHVQIFAVPPPGSSGGLAEEELEELARQVSADPELPYARVLVRAVQRAEPLTVAAAPIEGLAGLVALVVTGDRELLDTHADALHRVAVRLSRHFHALAELRAPGALAEEREPSGQGTGGEGPGAPDGPVFAPPGPEPTSASVGATPGQPEQAPGVANGGDEAVTHEAPRPQARPRNSDGSTGSWWAFPDEQTGLASLARFFSRVGRLLASDARDAGAFALVLVEIPTPETAPAAARALTSQLRFSDPVARIDGDLFAAAVLLLPATSRGEAVEDRLGSAVRASLEWLSPVRTTHVLAEPGDRRDVDELLRQAIGALSGRTTGGGGAPWRGAGGSAARLPFP